MSLDQAGVRTASINGVALHGTDETLTPQELRQRAYTELLRQAAQRAGFVAATDPPPSGGAISESAARGIERLLDSALALPEPDDAACRRYHAAHARQFAAGERVRLRHVLFAVTSGVEVALLRTRAEATLIDLRCASAAPAVTAEPGDGKFAAAARELSNCPSGAAGGDLGWLRADECAPEFAREVFGRTELGVLPHLVHSRFGLHIVDVLERDAGVVPAFDEVRSAVVQALQRQAFATALQQYLRVLAGQAAVDGVELDAAASPLVN